MRLRATATMPSPNTSIPVIADKSSIRVESSDFHESEVDEDLRELDMKEVQDPQEDMKAQAAVRLRAELDAQAAEIERRRAKLAEIEKKQASSIRAELERQKQDEKEAKQAETARLAAEWKTIYRRIWLGCDLRYSHSGSRTENVSWKCDGSEDRPLRFDEVGEYLIYKGCRSATWFEFVDQQERTMWHNGGHVVLHYDGTHKGLGWMRDPRNRYGYPTYLNSNARDTMHQRRMPDIPILLEDLKDILEYYNGRTLPNGVKVIWNGGTVTETTGDQFAGVCLKGNVIEHRERSRRRAGDAARCVFVPRCVYRNDVDYSHWSHPQALTIIKGRIEEGSAPAWPIEITEKGTLARWQDEEEKVYDVMKRIYSLTVANKFWHSWKDEHSSSLPAKLQGDWDPVYPTFESWAIDNRVKSLRSEGMELDERDDRHRVTMRERTTAESSRAANKERANRDSDPTEKKKPRVDQEYRREISRLEVEISSSTSEEGEPARSVISLSKQKHDPLPPSILPKEERSSVVRHLLESVHHKETLDDVICRMMTSSWVGEYTWPVAWNRHLIVTIGDKVIDSEHFHRKLSDITKKPDFSSVRIQLPDAVDEADYEDDTLDQVKLKFKEKLKVTQETLMTQRVTINDVNAGFTVIGSGGVISPVLIEGNEYNLVGSEGELECKDFLKGDEEVIRLRTEWFNIADDESEFEVTCCYCGQVCEEWETDPATGHTFCTGISKRDGCPCRCMHKDAGDKRMGIHIPIAEVCHPIKASEDQHSVTTPREASTPNATSTPRVILTPRQPDVVQIERDERAIQCPDTSSDGCHLTESSDSEETKLRKHDLEHAYECAKRGLNALKERMSSAKASHEEVSQEAIKRIKVTHEDGVREIEAVYGASRASLQHQHQMALEALDKRMNSELSSLKTRMDKEKGEILSRQEALRMSFDADRLHKEAVSMYNKDCMERDRNASLDEL